MTAEQAIKVWERADKALEDDPMMDKKRTRMLVAAARRDCWDMTKEEIQRFHMISMANCMSRQGN